MGDDRNGRVLRIDVLPLYEQYRVLLSPGCRQEIEKGSAEPDALLGAECSAEVGVLQVNPALVRNAQTLVEKCTPTTGPRGREQAVQCLDAVLKDQKRVMHQTIAAREIADYCRERYAGSPETTMACRDFGQGYLERDADLVRTHGYVAARAFEQGVEQLTAGVPTEARRSLEPTALRLAYHLYHSAQLRGEAAAFSFSEAIAAAQEKLAGVRDAARALEKAQVDQQIRARVEAEKRARPATPERTPVPVAAPKPAVDAQRRGLETRVLSSCEQLLDRYLATDHPLLKALEMTLPPHATLYLRALIVESMTDTIADLKSEALATTGPSTVLGTAIKDLHGKILERLVDRIARAHYAALGKSDVYDRLGEVGFSAKLNLFTYAGNTYPFAELPAEAKPLAEIMRTIDLWIVMRREDQVFGAIIKGAEQWVGQADTSIRQPSREALAVGMRTGLSNLYLGEAGWRKMIDGLLQK
ncbi:MAG: hypothetical protein HY696_02920 [Deltaproteobacteria bacterium]|nr:hypothetical protein [Deltaproteobacteria bacterium]